MINYFTMKHIQKLYLLIILLFSADIASAQGVIDIKLEFRKTAFSGTRLEVELWAARGEYYVPGDPSQGSFLGMDIRGDMEVVKSAGGLTSITPASGLISWDSRYLTSASFSLSAIGSPPPNHEEFELSLRRSNSLQDLPDDTVGVKLATFELYFAEPINRDNQLQPRPENNRNGSFWSNLDNSVARRPFNSMVLPVTLISFDLTKEGQLPVLHWATSEETFADRFDIQRSADSKKWQTIGSVKAAGESTSLVRYTFTDNTPMTGASYYRLKMIDVDETFAYSRIRTLKQDNETELVLFPNPTSDYLSVGAIDPARVQKVTVFDIAGKAVLRQHERMADPINISKLSTGNYVISILYDDGSHVSKQFIVKR
jgi:hypothetical protein